MCLHACHKLVSTKPRNLCIHVDVGILDVSPCPCMGCTGNFRWVVQKSVRACIFGRAHAWIVVAIKFLDNQPKNSFSLCSHPPTPRCKISISTNVQGTRATIIMRVCGFIAYLSRMVHRNLIQWPFVNTLLLGQWVTIG